MLKIRRPLGRLIFNMGIAIPGKTVFLIETAPWIHKRHPIPRPNGGVWGVCCEYLWGKWRRYNGTALYLQWRINGSVVSAIVSFDNSLMNALLQTIGQKEMIVCLFSVGQQYIKRGEMLIQIHIFLYSMKISATSRNIGMVYMNALEVIQTILPIK